MWPSGRNFSLPDDLLHGVSHLGQVDALTHQHLGTDAFRLAHEPEQEMLGPDIAVVEETGFFLSSGPRPDGPDR